MQYRDKEGAIHSFSAVVNPGWMTVLGQSYRGFKYDLEVDTFCGMCMSTWISETNAPVILGFHLAGVLGTRRGVAGTLSLREFDKAFEELGRKPGVLLCKDQGLLPTHQYGVKYFEGTKIHAKSPVNYLEAPGQVEYFGQVIGRARSESAVVTTPISKAVEEILGVPQKWGKPKFVPAWKPYQECLNAIASPTLPFPSDHLITAVNSYSNRMCGFLRDRPYLKFYVRSLTRMENLCGIDGKRFIDAIQDKTSLGFPLVGAKSKFITRLDPNDFEEFSCPKELDEKFWLEAHDIEQKYIAGERGYPIFKGCLKDEPTKLTKDKVRVFHAAPIAFQLLIRKYFLPIARFLQMNPLVAEMAVGINAQGPEWHQLAVHIRQHGSDRIVAGDYKKYDTKMPAQLTLAAFHILMNIAKESGNYSKTDLSIMDGIATDCCYPVVAMNGDLYQFFGSNPSGNNITVVINCLVNVLNLRCAYYSLRPLDNNVPFHENVALTTYGDDFKASVRKECTWFDHIKVANYLGTFGQVLTMPDKVSEPVAFMVDEDVDFLKRKNVFNPRLGMFMGALDEESIFKSLHSVLRSKAITVAEQSAQNIDGAVREYFAHGEVVYEQRRLQLAEVARQCRLEHMCRELADPYEYKLQQFCLKYKVEAEPPDHSLGDLGAVEKSSSSLVTSETTDTTLSSSL
jgi:hypothetical protein